MYKPHEEVVFEVTNSEGRRLHCVYDHPGDEAAPLVVIAPQYEGTVRHGLVPMLYLVSNGFRTVRFDFSNHRGNSEGDPLRFTMTGGLQDLRDVVAAVLGRYGGARPRTALLSASIASRLALRFLAEERAAFDCAVSLVGAVHLGETIRIATGYDIAKLMRDPTHRYGTQKALHYEIDGDHFMRDLLHGGWHSLEGTATDVTRMSTPSYLVVSEADAWVNEHDYDVAFARNASVLRGTYRIPNAGHELSKNFEAGKAAVRLAVRCLAEFFGIDAGELVEPTIVDVITLNTREREREKEYGRPRRERTAA